MDFSLSDEQRMLVDTVDRWLQADYTFEARRRWAASPPGFSSENWQRLADLGLLGMLVPEQFGGLAASAVEIMLVLRSFGRALVVEPYLPTAVHAVSLIGRVGSDRQRAQWLPAIAEGRCRFALAALDADAGVDLHCVSTRAELERDGWRLSGRKSVVSQGGAAQALIVAARSKGARADTHGITLFVVARDAPGVSLRISPTFDGLACADIELDGVRVTAADVLGEVDRGYDPLEWAVDRGIVALCAEALGAMEALCDQTASYLRGRKQFGQTLAQFQALQHRMADMLIATEQARSMAYMAAAQVDVADRQVRRRSLSAAKTLVGQAGRAVGQAAVQLHGGMGMTDELPVGHYFKRLTAIDLAWGSAAHHLETFGDLT